jgi:hypothetical protein
MAALPLNRARAAATLAAALALLATARAEPVRLQFLPPPMEGQLSLGIYDSSPRLVRVLHRAAPVDDPAFAQEADGLATSWDGRDDNGNPLPAGAYTARGFSVGELEVEGIAVHGNDWVDESDGPRPARLEEIRYSGTGPLLAQLAMTDGSRRWFVCDDTGQVAATEPPPPAEPAPEPSAPGARTNAPGPNNTTWAILASASTSAVVQLASTGETLREMKIPEGDPVPEQIAAAPGSETIYLLERNAATQRLRALRLENVGEEAGIPVSRWATLFEKNIRACDTAEAALPWLLFPDGSPFVPQAALRASLRMNPMDRDLPGSADLAFAQFPDGLWLVLADGLPLARVIGEPAPRWFRFGRAPGAKSITLFAGDGVAVDEFRIERVANMMAFDLGEFRLKPSPLPAPAPSRE